MNRDFILAVLTIVAINIILSGDNGIVIALTLRSLPRRTRVRAITTAAACDVSVRVCATFFAAQLLKLWFLRIAGGIFVLFLSTHLICEAVSGNAGEERIDGFWKAIWFILMADMTMSTDNTLAIAAVAQDSLPLLLIGLGLSIPCVLFGSSVLSGLLDKYRVLLYLGAGILAKVGGDMVITDAFTLHVFQPSVVWRRAAEFAAVIGVLGTVPILALYHRCARTAERVQRPATRPTHQLGSMGAIGDGLPI